MENNKALIVIPARSGSKRLPKKNTLRLCGKPMLYYTIKAALESGVTNEVYVLSDSQRTLRLAQGYGAKTFLLPLEMVGDTTGAVKASLYLVDHLKKKSESFQDLICLQPTSPLRRADDIKQSYALFKKNEADTLVSISEVDPHYFHWVVESSDNGISGGWGKLFFGDKFLKPRQELPTMYFPNGAVKIAKLNVLQQQGHFFGEKMATHIMPQERSIHVATKLDFTLCSLILKQRAKEEKRIKGETQR